MVSRCVIEASLLFTVGFPFFSYALALTSLTDCPLVALEWARLASTHPGTSARHECHLVHSLLF